MNVSEIIEQQRALQSYLDKRMYIIEQDMATCEGLAYAMLMDRLRLLYSQWIEAGYCIEQLQFVGPIATPEMQAEHKASQEYKRELELAAKREARVDLALKATNRV